jgi:hypothetical protein
VSDDSNLAKAQERFVSALVTGDELPPGFDVRGSRATSAILLGKRRHAVRRAVAPIPRFLGAEFGALFDRFATAHPIRGNGTAIVDAIAFLGWLRRNGVLPRELRYLTFKLRWRRISRR